MTLYEINNAIQDVLDYALDPETGEILDDALMASYDQLRMDRDEKIENIGCFIKNLEADAKAIREEEKSLADRRRAAENKAEHLRNYLQFCLAGQKFQSPRLAVSFRKSKKVVFDEAHLYDVPDDYLRYKEPELDKKLVAEALKAGEVIPGCELVESVSMIIK